MKKVVKSMALGLLSAMLVFNSAFSTVSFAEEGGIAEVEIADPSAEELSADVIDATDSDKEEEVTEPSAEDEIETPGEPSEDDADDVSDEDPDAPAEEGETTDDISDEEIEDPVETEEDSLDELTEDLEITEEEIELVDEEDSLLSDTIDPYSGDCGDSATWNYNKSTHILTISGSGRMYDYEEEYVSGKGYTSTAPWFQYASEITDLKISDDITYIGRAAFINIYVRTKEFYLPSALTEIGSYAFYYFGLYNSGSTLHIPGTVEYIPDHCFMKARAAFSTLQFHEGVKEIGDHAFESASFSNTIWADSITTIGESSFDFAGGPQSYVIPKGIKKIGKKGFYHIQHVRIITFEGDMPEMDEKAFGYNSVIAYYNPSNPTFTKAARDNASQYFDDVTWKPIGTPLNMKAGDNITWELNESTGTLRFVGSGAMYDYSSSNLPDWYYYAKKISKYYFDPRITEIGDYCFYHMGDFRNGDGGSGPVILPKNLKRIGKYGFSDCVFYNVTMPEIVEEFDDYSFYHTQYWDSTVFPKGVKRIGERAFYEVSFDDTEITLDSIEYIGERGLALSTYCENDTMSFEFPDSLKYIGERAFSGRITPTGSTLKLPKYLEYLGSSAFSGRKTLTGEVVVPNTITEAVDCAFSYTGISSIVYGDQLKEVGELAYRGMESLTSITYTGDFPNLKKDTFTSLENKTLKVYYPFDNETWIAGLSLLDYDPEEVEFIPVGDTTTVTFVDLSGKVVSTQTVAVNGKINAPSITLKSGQELGGWYIDKTVQFEGTKWNFENPVKNKMTLYAGLKYSGHRVVFYPRNGETPIIKNVADGECVKEFTPEYKGYRFIAWYSSKNFSSETRFKFNVPIEADVALYANWKVFLPIITYNHDKYKYISTWQHSCQVGDTFAADHPSIAAHESRGYCEFQGWFWDEDFKKPVSSDYKVTKDITVYGKWKIATHTATFNYGDGREPLVMVVPHYEEVVFPEDPTRKGFYFKGWTLDPEEGKTEYHGVWYLQEDISYYAVWGARQIKAEYRVTPKTGNTQSDYKYMYAGDTFVDVYDEKFADYLDGYIFDGWFYDEAFKKPVAEGTVLVENTTFYGKIHLKTYTVTVDPANDEEVLVFTVEHGENVDVAIPVRRGYQFTGWTETREDGSQTTTSRITNVRNDRSFKARWSREDYFQNIVIKGVSDTVYTGAAVTFPDIKITDGSYNLENGRDYTLKYKNNTSVGTASLTVTYKGLYKGKSQVSFNIVKADIGKLKGEGLVVSSFETSTLSYNKKIQKAKPKITYTVNGKTITLKEKKDYKLVYVGTDKKADDYNAAAFKEVGSYTIEVVGMGNYTGSFKLTETITEDKLVDKLTVSGLKKSYSYTGEEILPQFTVKDKNVVIGEYTESGFVSSVLDCSVASNIVAGTAKIVLTAKAGSGYAGQKTLTFKVAGTPLSKAYFDGFNKSIDCDSGKEITQDVVIYKSAAYKKSGDPEGVLVEGTDYTVTYLNNVGAGTATVIYTGINGYTGTVKKTFAIKKKSLKKAVVSGIVDSSFTGKAIRQAGITVTDSATKLVLNGIDVEEYNKLSSVKKRDYDYIVSYSGNKNRGTAKVIITGVNGYDGTLTKSFNIGAADLSLVGTLTSDETAEYTKGSCRPSSISVKATIDEKTYYLVEGYDYSVKVVGNDKVGQEATLEVTGMGNYSGTLKKTFTVTKGITSHCHTVVETPAYKDKVGNFVCKVTVYDKDWNLLKEGVDYKKIEYKKSGNVLDPKKDKIKLSESYNFNIEGMGEFEGGFMHWWNLYEKAKTSGSYNPPKPLSSCTFTLRDYTYSGSEIRPNTNNLIIKDKGKTVTSYSVVGYENNVEVGTASLVLRGTGNYTGIYRLKFKILPRTVYSDTTKATK